MTLYIIISSVVGLGVGILLAYTMLKKTLEKGSQRLVKDAQEEAELIKKRENTSSKREVLATENST